MSPRNSPRGDVWYSSIRPAGDWIDQAACRHSNLATFFPAVGDRRAYLNAVAVCEMCPVRRQCLDYAVANRIKFGVWGGLNEDRRRKLRNPQRARRPMPAHGPGRYRKGCRCDECREAHRIESIRYREAAAVRTDRP
jgi:WhiB family transcriptional regulator, redox-sensing transcriptional regulator